MPSAKKHSRVTFAYPGLNHIIMKTKLLFIWAALGLLLAACEGEETVEPSRSYKMKVFAGMPGVYGYAKDGLALHHPVAEVAVKVYRSWEDYVLSQNPVFEGFTNDEGLFTFETDSIGSLWYSVHKDTLSNLRGVTSLNENSGIQHNEIIIGMDDPRGHTRDGSFATLTNTPTRLQLSVSHQGQPVEGATVQLYFTEQTYQDSLAAQEDFDHLRPTYGYFVDDPSVSDEKEYLTYIVQDNFLQTTNEAGEVFFNNLEPRNYWFRITKDTLSNENTTIRTLGTLPRDADITTSMTVGIN